LRLRKKKRSQRERKGKTDKMKTRAGETFE